MSRSLNKLEVLEMDGAETASAMVWIPGRDTPLEIGAGEVSREGICEESRVGVVGMDDGVFER